MDRRTSSDFEFPGSSGRPHPIRDAPRRQHLRSSVSQQLQRFVTLSFVLPGRQGSSRFLSNSTLDTKVHLEFDQPRWDAFIDDFVTKSLDYSTSSTLGGNPGAAFAAHSRRTTSRAGGGAAHMQAALDVNLPSHASAIVTASDVVESLTVG